MKNLVLIFFLLFGIATADQGMTSPTHSANVGKILFSTEEIQFRKEDPSKLRKSFKLGEPIYGRMYFAQCLGQTTLYHTQADDSMGPGTSRDGDWEVLVYVDGENQKMKFQKFAVGRVNDKVLNDWTTWQLNLAPSDPAHGERSITEPWIKVAARLKPGTHDIKVVFNHVQGQYKSKPMAQGSFKLAVEEGSSFAAGSFPQSSYSGSDLNSLRQAMKRAIVGPVAKSPGEVLDVSVTSDWLPGRFTDTLMEYRKIQGTVLWADKDGDGVCRYTTYSFIQTKQGSGWSPLKFRGFVNGGLEGNYKP